MQWEGWAVLVVMLIALVLLYSEFRPPDIVLLGALAVVWNLGIIETKDAILGFSNSSLITVGALFIVVEGVDKAKVVDKVARKCLGKKTTEFGALLRLCSLGLAFSGFFNNTPLVALLMPILRDWARGRNFAPSKFLIPLSFSTIGGGLMTIIGTSTNLVIIGMMEKSGEGEKESFGFFDPAKVGGPVSLLALLYLLTLGRHLLPDNRGGMFREVAHHTADWLTELFVTEDFPLVGRNLWEVVEYLGLPKESIKKIFRIQKENNEPADALLKRRKGTIDALTFNVTPRMRQQISGSTNQDGHGDTIVSLDALDDWSQPKASRNGSDLTHPKSTSSRSGNGCLSAANVSFEIPPPEISRGDLEWGVNVDNELASPSPTPETNTGTISANASETSLTKASRRRHYRQRTMGFFSEAEVGRKVTLNLEQVVLSPSDPDISSKDRPSGRTGTPSSRVIHAVSSGSSLPSPNDDNVIEIGPVSEQHYPHLVLEGGDTLVLNLPIKACMKLFQTPAIWNRLKDLVGSKEASSFVDSAATPASDVTALTAKLRNSLLIQNVNFLDLPGWKDEFVELVLSAKNPFVGKDLKWKLRQQFESFYQVSVIAVRHSGERHLDKKMTERSISGVLKRTLTKASRSRIVQKDDSHSKSQVTLGNFTSHPRQKLRPGDTVLVLSHSEADRLQAGQDFLTVTRVGHERKGGANPLDYVPLVLFIAALTAVALQAIPMVQASIGLAVIFVFGGWVEPKRIRECVDWNLMILIGSALGLSAAVRESGLSAGVASIVKSANLGPWGSVYLLYFFTMLITELVTNNAAAALGYPLAVDLTRAMGLKSTKPLVMTVMLAASTSYASPIGYATNLMVLGPGGYSFTDFLKVGLPMDIIYWLGCSTFLPVIWPLEKL